MRIPYEQDTFVESLQSIESRSIEPKEVLSQYEDYYRKELSYKYKESMLDAFLGEDF